MTAPRIGYIDDPVVHLCHGTHSPKTACGLVRESLEPPHVWVRQERAWQVTCAICQKHAQGALNAPHRSQ